MVHAPGNHLRENPRGALGGGRDIGRTACPQHVPGPSNWGELNIRVEGLGLRVEGLGFRV